MPDFSTVAAQFNSLTGATPSWRNAKAPDLWDVKLDIVDETGKSVATALGLKSGAYRFQLPPQGFSIDQGWRAEVGLDLAGKPLLYSAGRGVYRIALNGIFTPMPQKTTTSRYNGSASKAVGLMGIFNAYAKQLKDRSSKGDAPYRMVLRTSAPNNEAVFEMNHWVEPTAMPSIRQSLSHPLSVDWSIQLWALDRVPMPPLDLLTGKGAPTIAALTGWAKAIDVALKAWNIAKAVKETLRKLRNLIVTMRAAVLQKVRDLTDMARSTANFATSIAKALDTQTLKTEVGANLRGTMLDIRKAMGSHLRMMRTNAGIPASSTVATTAPVMPGHGLQEMAASSAAGFAAWKALAHKNKLRYPYREG